MYCPLCKAEYRPGFDRCSDCFSKLVPREQADAAKVCLLWEGMGLSTFNRIAVTLGDANIPNHSRSKAQAERQFTILSHIPIFGWFVRLNRTRELLYWQVFVLESDLHNAEMLVRDIEGAK